jgi:hypothetical protein
MLLTTCIKFFKLLESYGCVVVHFLQKNNGLTTRDEDVYWQPFLFLVLNSIVLILCMPVCCSNVKSVFFR